MAEPSDAEAGGVASGQAGLEGLDATKLTSKGTNDLLFLFASVFFVGTGRRMKEYLQQIN